MFCRWFCLWKSVLQIMSKPSSSTTLPRRYDPATKGCLYERQDEIFTGI